MRGTCCPQGGCSLELKVHSADRCLCGSGKQHAACAAESISTSNPEQLATHCKGGSWHRRHARPTTASK